jgi:Domain of unknown function (DUF4296)
MNKLKLKSKSRFNCSTGGFGNLKIIQTHIHLFIYGTFLGSVLALSVLLISCSGEPKNQDKIIDAYIDLRIAEDTLKADGPELDKLKTEILNKNNLTEKEYEAAINYYNENPQMWDNFYNKIIARADTLMKRKKK